ncbi:alkyl sulfatase C-terminal domain-containing protein, partial [Nocardia nova]
RAALLGTEDLSHLIADGRIVVDGDPTKLAELVGYLDNPDPDFAIVTP